MFPADVVIRRRHQPGRVLSAATLRLTAALAQVAPPIADQIRLEGEDDESPSRIEGPISWKLVGPAWRASWSSAVGLTPHAYLVHIGLNAACRLLRHGRSLADSAPAAGFCDQAALNKHFRRCYGITPLQFAQAARAG
ncbi:helix-turn-helix transcriptional regulator [Bradyrhizobium vignae]|uniref:Helix-turn-helix transcriptional regulator n=1 Tax=Bradyrhizobium vignae TaxID=1549949 RepID=A0ABS3ZW63_9BRAD|nr:helix-turn-helix transcriptional regulator [Bradyrhizobium vignae]